MEIATTGIVIQIKTLQEGRKLLSLFTPTHGVMKGIARGGAKTSLDLGYHCDFRWKARLEEHLGTVQYDVVARDPLQFWENGLRLQCLQSACAMIEKIAPLHHAYEVLYNALDMFLKTDTRKWHYAYVQFELSLLACSGFGLSLNQCAATGAESDLYYISPKSGRAVSMEAGAPYHDKLFLMPALFHDIVESTLEGKDFSYAIYVLGYFLKKHLFPYQLPTARMILGQHISRLKSVA